MQLNLCAIMNTTVLWKLCHVSDTCNGLALGSSAVCGGEISSTVAQENTRMLYIVILFARVEIKLVKWCKISL